MYMECLGCRIANGVEPNLHILYEDELITCALDIAPFNEGHMLILPKQHYWDVEEMDSETSCTSFQDTRVMDLRGVNHCIRMVLNND